MTYWRLATRSCLYDGQMETLQDMLYIAGIKNHYKAYLNVMKDKIFYPKTTKKYKEFIENNYKDYLKNKNK